MDHSWGIDSLNDAVPWDVSYTDSDEACQDVSCYDRAPDSYRVTWACCTLNELGLLLAKAAFCLQMGEASWRNLMGLGT